MIRLGKVEAAVALQKGNDLLKTAREHRDKQEFDVALEQYNQAKKELKKADVPDKGIHATVATVYIERGDLYQKRGHFYLREDHARAHHLFKQALASYKKATLEPYNLSCDEKIATLKLPSTPAPWQLVSKVEDAKASIKQRFVSSSQPVVCFFKTNQSLTPSTPGKIYDPVTEVMQLVDTRHLAWCLQQGYLSETQEKKFKQFARLLLEAFAETETKDYFELVQEIVPLASIADTELYQQLISQTVNALSANQSVLLNVSIVQGLAAIIRRCPQALLSQVRSGDLVEALKVLRARLDKVHKDSNVIQCQSLLHTTTQLLEAMTCLGVSGIDREEVQAPLNATLSGLMGHSNSVLSWQARYARQALTHIPNNEAVWECVLRHTFNVGKGILNVAAAIKNLDVDKLEESLSRFEEAFFGVREIALAIGQVGNAAKVTLETLEKEYQMARDGLKQLNRPHGWYAALRFADLLLEANKLEVLEKLARDTRYGQNEKFLQGLCQRLEQVARTHSDPERRKEAERFLENLSQDEATWGGHERVVKMAEAVLQSLKQPEPKGGQDYIVAWSSLWEEPSGTRLLDKVKGDNRLNQVPDKLESLILSLDGLPWVKQKMQDVLEQQMQKTQDLLEQQMQQIKRLLEESQASSPLPDLTSLTTLLTDLKEQKEEYLRRLEETGEVTGALAMYWAMQGAAASPANQHLGLDDAATVLFASNERVRQISQQLEKMKAQIPMLLELEQRQRAQWPSEESGAAQVQIATGVGNTIMAGSDNVNRADYSTAALTSPSQTASQEQSIQDLAEVFSTLALRSQARGGKFMFQLISGTANSAISGNNNRNTVTDGSSHVSTTVSDQTTLEVAKK